MTPMRRPRTDGHDKLQGVPGKGTDRKTIRVEPALWDALETATRQLGTDRSTWIRDAICWCVGWPGAEAPKRPEPDQHPAPESSE